MRQRGKWPWNGDTSIDFGVLLCKNILFQKSNDNVTDGWAGLDGRGRFFLHQAWQNNGFVSWLLFIFARLPQTDRKKFITPSNGSTTKFREKAVTDFKRNDCRESDMA